MDESRYEGRSEEDKARLKKNDEKHLKSVEKYAQDAGSDACKVNMTQKRKVTFDNDNLYLSSLIEVLREVMNDKDDFISWWLYEDVEKVIWLDDGTRIELNTAEDLYDYLLRYM